MVASVFQAYFGFLWLLSTLPTPAAGADTYIATATLITNPSLAPGQSPSYVVGTLSFTQKAGETKVIIEGQLQVGTDFQFVNTSIGFHVHQTSNFSGGCVSAGAHYNPDNKTHGGPNDTTRHVGDLGNVEFDRNTRTSRVYITDSVISLIGSRSIIGRSLVLHTGTDDLGRGGNDESLKTGNAGGRYACGPIVLASDFSPNSASAVISGNRVIITSLIALFSTAAFRIRL